MSTTTTKNDENDENDQDENFEITKSLSGED